MSSPNVGAKLCQWKSQIHVHVAVSIVPWSRSLTARKDGLALSAAKTLAPSPTRREVKDQARERVGAVRSRVTGPTHKMEWCRGLSCLHSSRNLHRKKNWLGIVKAILYFGPLFVVVPLCLLWGAAVALLLHYGFKAFHPGLVVKIFAYGAGAYVSTPNFGLFAEGTIPPEAQARHQLITSLPFVTFLVAAVVLAYAHF